MNIDNKKNKTKEQERISQILIKLESLYPNATTDLKYENTFQLLIATILAAQCTDQRVNKVTEKLFKKYVGPEAFAMAKEQELQEDIRQCGLFRNKSKNIIGTAKMLLENYNGEVPGSFDELIKLPGVGRKTANVILANAFDIPAFAVDTHVYRLAHRLGFSTEKDVKGVEKDLTEKIPKSLWIKAHHWLIQHGRNLCKARSPQCDKCPLQELCVEYEKRSKKNLS